MIDAAAIRARMNELRQDEARLVEMHAQVIGAIEDCRYWLAQIESETNEAQAQAAQGVQDDHLSGMRPV